MTQTCAHTVTNIPFWFRADISKVNICGGGAGRLCDGGPGAALQGLPLAAG